MANKFAHDLLLSERAVLHSVASRDIEKAKSFSLKFNSINYYDSYDELANNPEIDIVYIATPHSFHFENTMMCLKKGKSVLCEKPLGVNSKEVEIMQKEAKSRNLFLMEGIWTRFIPATEKLIELLNEKVIGNVLFIRADFGFKADFNTDGRIFNKKLAGGSLLDIGIYPIYLSLLILGFPTEIKAMARMTESDVDSYCSMLFNYKNSAKAILESTFEANSPIEAYIYGEKGHIKLHSRFHHTEKLSIYLNGELNKTFIIKYKGEGYLHEIEEVNDCLLTNKTESIKLQHTTSLELIKIIDQVKTKIGLSYTNSN
ncbi:MAG: hypothetical protein A2W99_08350 [Bacteroidetes bacterium GWF2_33_16]|nr:MAG: hypothetical protein A2X00_00805 [Bacteroidetes bacterium GWE2_32_14]OFY05515.1 MAG: hypothetical protein A2W99_08350 [Bacteroidetes bacterium GWF2_33_16]